MKSKRFAIAANSGSHLIKLNKKGESKQKPE